MAYIQDLLGEEFNIALFFSIVRKSIIWIILMILIGCTIVFLYIRYTLPSYEATSTLMMKREKTLKQELFGGASNILASNIEEASMETQLIKSKYYVQKVISKLPFDVSYHKEGRTKFVSSELYTATPFLVKATEIINPGVFGKEIYVEIIDGKSYILRYDFEGKSYREILSFDKFYETPLLNISISLAPGIRETIMNYSGKSYFFRINDIERYAEYLAQKITIIPIDPSTRTIRIKYQDKNKAKASDLVNALAREFVEFDVERQAESADKILSFLQSEIDSFSDDMVAYQDTLKKYRMEKNFIDPEQEMQGLIQSLRSIESEKSQYLVDLKIIEWFFNYVGNLTDLQNISSGIFSDDVPVVSGYISSIKSLVEEKEAMLLNVSAEHPNVKMIDDKVIKAKNDMLNDLDNIVLKKNYKVESLEGQYGQILYRLLTLPEEQEAYGRLKRRYDAMASYYSQLVSKQTDYKLAKAGMVSDYIVLNTSSVPQMPIGPKNSYLWGIAVAVGLVLGFVLIVVRYMLHNTIISIETISKNTKASILGIIPTVFTDIPLTGIVVTQNPKSIITEAFRALRNNLQFISNTPGPKTIAITSTISGEGKTFVSINVGAILSLLDKKVIVVDVDMRRPRLSKIFNVDNVSGMSTILIGRDKAEDCIRKTELKNFDYITSGPIPPNPAELILSERLTEMVEYLKSKYDYIIFDTPPLGLVTDGFEIIKNVDYPIYVFRAEYSSKSFVSNLDKLMNENKVTRLSTVLNDVGRGVSGYYYGGYSYKYGYSYGYLYSYRDSGYYAEDVKTKKPFLKKIFGKSS